MNLSSKWTGQVQSNDERSSKQSALWLSCRDGDMAIGTGIDPLAKLVATSGIDPQHELAPFLFRIRRAQNGRKLTAALP